MIPSSGLSSGPSSEAAQTDPESHARTRGEPTDTEGRSKPSPGLHLVSTPIGNAQDITLRALWVLENADTIACEDTRVTGKLLRIHGISAPMTPYHEHNAEAVRPRLIERLNKGQVVALTSDAGTPLVSDPGHKLVRACLDAGIGVVPVPGASALLPALQLSGLPSDRFLFAGFPPSKKGQRERFLQELEGVPATLVFLESARRLAASLGDMARILGDRPAAVTRELTKMYEEARRGTLANLAAHYAETGPPKGEVTVVVGGPAPAAPPSQADVDRALGAALAETGVRDAAARVAAETGLPRRDLYARALALREEER